jgi:glycosyltransferase involved in cell wall biosynthesis
VHVLAWRDLYDVEAGGSEIHADHVLSLWAEAGVEVMLRTSHAQGQPPEEVRNGYRVIRRAGRYLVFPRSAVSEVLGRSGPRDAIVEIWNGMPFFTPLWSGHPRLAILHHIHAEMWAMALPENLARVGDFVERQAAPFLYRRTPIATLADSSRTELIHDLGFRPDRVHVVPPGIEPRYSPGGDRAPHPLLVAVGRLVPVKQYDRLLQAVAIARQTVPDLELVIVGEGLLKGELVRLIEELDIGSFVSLVGRQSDEDLLALYRRAWAVVSASAREGWGMTLTEAGACGTPAIATRIPGHADAVIDGTSGILVAPDDDQALADGIARVMRDPDERERLSRGAREHAATLTWTRTATDLMRILAADARSRPR